MKSHTVSPADQATHHTFGKIRLMVRPDVVLAALPGQWFPGDVPAYMAVAKNPYWEGDTWLRRGEEIIATDRRTWVIGALRAVKRELQAAEPEHLLIIGPQPISDVAAAIRFLVNLKSARHKEPALPLETDR